MVVTPQVLSTPALAVNSGSLPLGPFHLPQSIAECTGSKSNLNMPAACAFPETKHTKIIPCSESNTSLQSRTSHCEVVYKQGARVVLSKISIFPYLERALHAGLTGCVSSVLDRKIASTERCQHFKSCIRQITLTPLPAPRHPKE